MKRIIFEKKKKIKQRIARPDELAGGGSVPWQLEWCVHIVLALGSSSGF